METIKSVIMAILAIVGIGLVIWGQRTVGVSYLLVQFVGLALILVAIGMYNSKYK